jgi:TolB-like protein/Flp pilus assembly protein TadD
MPEPHGYQRFFAELKRRKVFRVMAVYGIVGFVLLQVVDLAVPALLLPDWTYRFIALILLIGFPIAVILAWAYERTPAGLQKTERAEPGEITQIVSAPATRRWPIGLAAAGGTALFLLTAWFVLGRPAPGEVGAGGAEAQTTEGEASGRGVSKPAEASIAVLPFANLSGDDETQPFADGLHDDLLTQLSGIASLKVISRTSVLEYRNTTKNVREIAEELGVGSILEGGVQKAGDRFRLNVQLIDAATDDHLWAKSYSGELTTATIFDVQAEIASEITSALQAQLSPEERADIARPPTDDVEAYESYLAAVDLWRTGQSIERDLQAADALVSRALERDSSFAEAWAVKSLVTGEFYWFFIDRSDSIQDVAHRAALRSLELQPDLPLGHLAMAAYYYRFRLDYDRALGELDGYGELHPPTEESESMRGAILRRKGDVEEALGRFQRAVELDPRSAPDAAEVGFTYYLLRRYDEAEDWIRRALALQPDGHGNFAYLAMIRLRADGDTAGAREWLERARAAGVYQPRITDFSFVELARAARQPDRMIEESERMTGPLDNQWVYMPPVLWRALAWRFEGEDARAIAAFDSARVELEAALESDPAEPRMRSALGIAYAGLGRKEDALREGEEGVRLMPLDREAWRGGFRVLQLARIEAMVGEDERAVDHLRQLLSIPFDLTVAELRLDPSWDGLRGNPRFQALLEEE